MLVFFNRLSDVHQNVKIKIGIEIYKPYIDNAKFHNCIKIHGDALNYKVLLKKYDVDTVLIVDVLEHFKKEIGFNLINVLKEDFNRILLMLPIGKYEQHRDVTGFGGHEYQTHNSYWYIDDIKKLEFNNNIIDPTFHPKHHQGDIINIDTACYFGIWDKK